MPGTTKPLHELSIAEAGAKLGLARFDISTWFGLFGPAGLPADVTGKLNKAFTAALATPETQARFNLDFPAYLDGPIDVDVAMVAYRDGRRLIDLGLDLARTTVKAPELDWARPPGKKLDAKMRLLLRRDTLVLTRNAVEQLEARLK